MKAKLLILKQDEKGRYNTLENELIYNTNDGVLKLFKDFTININNYKQKKIFDSVKNELTLYTYTYYNVYAANGITLEKQVKYLYKMIIDLNDDRIS